MFLPHEKFIGKDLLLLESSNNVHSGYCFLEMTNKRGLCIRLQSFDFPGRVHVPGNKLIVYYTTDCSHNEIERSGNADQ